MKNKTVICVTSEEIYLTKDKSYPLLHIYQNSQFEVFNDLGHRKYYPKRYFMVIS